MRRLTGKRRQWWQVGSGTTFVIAAECPMLPSFEEMG